MSGKDITLKVTDISGKETGSLTINADALGGKVRKRLLKDVVVMYERNQRQGSANTKTRAEIARSIKKPWRQKGTGRARAGSRGSNIWRGGGVAHGPKPKDWSVDIPVKMRRRALGSALLAKIESGDLLVVDSLSMDTPKTKAAMTVVENLNLDGRSLLANHEFNENQLLAFRNIPWIETSEAGDLNALNVCRSGKVVITKEGLEALVERLDVTRRKEAVSA